MLTPAGTDASLKVQSRDTWSEAKMNSHMYRLSIRLGAGWLIVMESEDLNKVERKAAKLRDKYWVAMERI